jgi:hypothetical protein
MVQNAIFESPIAAVQNSACLGKIGIKGTITICEFLEKLNRALQITGDITDANQPSFALQLPHLFIRYQPRKLRVPVHAGHQHGNKRKIFFVEYWRVVLRVHVIVRFVERRGLRVFHHVMSIDFFKYKIKTYYVDLLEVNWVLFIKEDLV